MANGSQNMTSYKSRRLSHTPGTDETFLRGDNDFTNELGNDLLPTENEEYDLGAANKKWNDAYINNIILNSATPNRIVWTDENKNLISENHYADEDKIGINIPDVNNYTQTENFRVFGSVATGDSSVTAKGANSHAEGENTLALGEGSHAEGASTGTISYEITISGSANATTYTASSAANAAVNNVLVYNGNARTITAISGSNITVSSTYDESNAITNGTAYIIKQGAAGAYSHAEGYQTLAGAIGAHAEGQSTLALGAQSHTEGNGNIVIGDYSHAEGVSNTVVGNRSHAEGTSNIVNGDYAHAEGGNADVLGMCAHAEGNYATAAGSNSHAEGYGTRAGGPGAHAEGYAMTFWIKRVANQTTEYIVYSRQGTAPDYEYIQMDYQRMCANAYVLYNGVKTKITAFDMLTSKMTLESALEGSIPTDSYTEIKIVGTAASQGSHIEGGALYAAGTNAHAEGSSTRAYGGAAHAEGWATNAYANYSHAEGLGTSATAANAHSEGAITNASGNAAHAEGSTINVYLTGGANATTYTCYNGTGSNAALSVEFLKPNADLYYRGIRRRISSIDTTNKTVTLDGTLGPALDKTAVLVVGYASGQGAHREGGALYASGNYSHAEGKSTYASEEAAHAEGRETVASGGGAHAEGRGSEASGTYAHAEGYGTTASDQCAHAEGNGTTASGVSSHSEGAGTTASGAQGAHAEGRGGIASGDSAHAEGYYTIANHRSQHVFGEYNTEDDSTAAATEKGNYVEIVGNGTATNARNNVRTLDWTGGMTLNANKSTGTTNSVLTLNNSNTLGTGTSETWGWMITAAAANMKSNSNIIFQLRHSTGTNDGGYIGFHYDTTEANRFLTLGLVSNDHRIKIYPNYVEIGKTAATHTGLKIGQTYITAIATTGTSNSLLLQNNSEIRFGSDNWNWTEWAGLKYDPSATTIYLGLADGTYFYKTSSQSVPANGTLALPAIPYVSINGKVAFRSTDGWLRLNQNSAGNADFTSGVYINSLLNIKGNTYPNSTNSYSLGTSTYRWKAAFIGTADSYGSATQPVYWSNGVPTVCTAYTGLFTGLSWSNGTTAGPSLNVVVGGTSKSAAIPLASASQSGAVSTAAQTFAGNKAFAGIIHPSTSRGYTLGHSNYYWSKGYISDPDGSNTATIHIGNISAGHQTHLGCHIGSTHGIIGFFNNMSRGNRLYGVSAEAISITYSSNGTATSPTWTATGAPAETDRTKENLFNYTNLTSQAVTVGHIAYDAGSGNTNSATAVGKAICVTVDLTKENRSGGYITAISTYVLTRGSTCTLEIQRYNTANNVWTSLYTKTGLVCDDWVTVYFNSNVMELYGANSSTTARRTNKIRWFLTVTALGTANRYAPTLSGFQAFGYGGTSISCNTTLYAGQYASYAIARAEVLPMWNINRSSSTPQVGVAASLIPYYHIGTNAVNSAALNLGTSSNKWGNIYGTKVYGGVWNDYAEFRSTDVDIEPGRCVKENGKDSLELTTKRLERGCEIVSDTYGFGIGESDNCKTPIASSGRVLAYPYESREEFAKHIGWPVCSGPDGTVSLMTEEEEEKYPSRIIGTVSAVPDYEQWGDNAVGVNGRVWIRIR